MSPKPKANATSSQPALRGFDQELALLEAFGEAVKGGARPSPDQVLYLRRSLTHRNNFLVSKATKLVTECELTGLLPDILTAYDRFFADPARSDPKCWAKEALAKALVKLGHRSKADYLRGMRHHQMEPSFGPPIDTAGSLRATCAHALVDCPGISDADLLTALLEPLNDADKSVRAEGVRAIAAVGGVSAALLLRLRAMMANAEPEAEVLGAVYSALLSLEGAEAIPLVAAALDGGDDTAAEAAFALAELRTSEALAALLYRLQAGADAWLSKVLLSAIALTRLPEAIDLLISTIARDARDAPGAIEAIAGSAPSDELRGRVKQAVEQADSMRLTQAFRKYLTAVVE